MIYYGYRFYEPELGRWVNRDPIEEDGGLNLHGYVGNEPLGTAARLGRDFIAVAARLLDHIIFQTIGTGVGLAYHSSIEYWESNCKAGIKEWDRADFEKMGGKRVKSVELLASHRWQILNSDGEYEKIPISTISFSSTGEWFKSFYEPAQNNKSAVKKKWSKIESFANNYPFAALLSKIGFK